jgi:multiple sugar transport system ATP-binding protein
VLERRPGLRKYDGSQIVIGIRPEDLEDETVDAAGNGNRTLPVKVLLREGLGSEVLIHAHVDARAPHVETAHVAEEGTLLEGDGVVIIARLDPRTTVAIDQPANLAVDVERMHFFDPATGLAIRD